MKKTLLAASVGLITITSVLFAGGQTIANAQSITLQQLVQLFISLGIIPADKAAAAEEAVANINIVSPTSTSTVTTTTTVAGILTVNLNSVPAPRQNVFAGDKQDTLLGIKLQAQLSPITIQRVQVDLGNSTSFYTKYFTNLYLMSDTGQVLAQAALNSTTVTEQTVGSTNTYYLTFSGFNYTVPGDDSIHVLTVKGDVYSSIDPSLTGTSVSIGLDSGAIRGVDGAGIDQYGPTGAGADVFSNSVIINQALFSNTSLQLSADSATPLAETVVANQGANNNEADEVTAIVFDLRATNTATINTVQSHFSVTGTGSAYVSTAYLYSGSQEIASAAVTGGNATFSNIGYAIPANNTSAFTVRVDIKNANNSQVIITPSITSVTATNSISGFTSSGSAIGNPITVIQNGAVFSLVGTPSITTSQTPIANNHSTTTVTANFVLNIQASGGNLIFGTQASASTFNFGIYANGIEVTPGVAMQTSWSVPTSGVVTTGLANGQAFELQQNNSVQIPISFLFQGNTYSGTSLSSGAYAIGLDSIRYINNSGAVQTANYMSGSTSWRTSNISLAGTGSTQTNPTNAQPTFTLASTPTITQSQTPLQNNQSTTTVTAQFNVNIQAVGGDFIFPTQSTGSAFNFTIYQNGVASDPAVISSTNWSVPTSGVVTTGLQNGQAFKLTQNNSVQIPVTFTFRPMYPITTPVNVAVGLGGINYMSSTGVAQTVNLSGSTSWRTSSIVLMGTVTTTTPVTPPVLSPTTSSPLTLSSTSTLKLSSSAPIAQAANFIGPIQQTINIIQPNGSTSYQAGGTVNLQWTSTALSSPLNANLVSSNNTYSIFLGLSTSTNSYSYTIPSSVVNGNYQVSLSSGSIHVLGNQFLISGPLTSNQGSVSSAVSSTSTSISSTQPPQPTSVSLNPNQDYYFHTSGTVTLSDITNAGGLVSSSNLTPVDSLLFFTGNPPASTDSAVVSYFPYNGQGGSGWLQLGNSSGFATNTQTLSTYFIIRKSSSDGSSATFTVPSNVIYDGATAQNSQPRPWNQQSLAKPSNMVASIITAVESLFGR